MLPRPIPSNHGQSFSNADIGDLSWYTVYIILIDNLISFAFIYFFWTTPFFQRALCTGRQRWWIARCLSASNRLTIGLMFGALKIQAVYLVYGTHNVLFWATVANSLFIVALILDAVAWNRGPFKYMRGNTKAGTLPPLRRKNGSIVSVFDTAQWAIVAQNRTNAAIPFTNTKMMDEYEDDQIRDSDQIYQEELEKRNYPYFPMLSNNGGVLPGNVKLKFGPCNLFRTNVGVETWNKMMVDSMHSSLIPWMTRNSVHVPNRMLEAVDSHRGRAMLVMRHDGALRSVLFTIPNASTIFEVCGIISSKEGSGGGARRRMTGGWTAPWRRDKINGQEGRGEGRGDGRGEGSGEGRRRRSNDNNRAFSNIGNRPRVSPSSCTPAREGDSNPTEFKTRSRSDTPIYLPPPSPPLFPSVVHNDTSFRLPTLTLPSRNDANTTLNNGPANGPANGDSSPSNRVTSATTKSSPSPSPSMNAWTFEIVMKTYVGNEEQKYWYYASYPEFGLEPNDLQKLSLKKIIDHLNGGKPSRSLRSVQCKNIFQSGDHQIFAETKRPRKSRHREWLMLRS